MKVIEKADDGVTMPEIVEELLEPLPKRLHKSGRGNKLVLNEEQISQIEVMAGLGLSVPQISLIMGFTERTLYNKQNEDERVMEAMKRGQARAASQVAQTAFQLAKSGKYPAMTMFWLKCRQKWREYHEPEVKTTNQIVFKTQIGEGGKIHQEQIDRRADEES